MTASQGLRDAFRAFRDQCIWLRTCFNTFETLFHSDEPKRVMHASARYFFRDLNLAMLEYTRLQACKITDPAESKVRGVPTEALTSNNLDMHLRRELLMTPKIEAASAELMRYRKLVKPSRDQGIAHLDKAATLANQPLGAHALQDVENFLEHLQAYNDEVGRAVGEGPLDFRVQSSDGDATTLLQLLRVGLHVKRTDNDAFWAVANKPVQ